MKNKSKKKLKEHLNHKKLNMYFHLAEIYNIIDKSSCHSFMGYNYEENLFATVIIYMLIFQVNNSLFNSLNIDLSTICNSLRISNCFDNIGQSEINYKLITKKILNNYSKVEDIDSLMAKDINDLFKDLVLNPDGKFVKLNILNLQKRIQEEVKKEEKLSSFEQDLKQYSDIYPLEVKIEGIKEILNFGNELSDLSDIISKRSKLLLEKNDELEYDLEKIKGDINDLKKGPSNQIISFFRKPKENNVQTRKEVLTRLDEYFKHKEYTLKNGLLELQHIRTAIGVYLTKSDVYLKCLSDAKTSLNDEISNRIYTDTDLRVYDDQLKQQLINDKISSINESIIKMLEQYERITLQMSVSASLINQINITRSTTLQNLYIELVLNEGITRQKDTIDSLNGLVNLLNNMSMVNSNGLVDNINKINNINKDNIKTLTEQDKLLIKQVLEEQGLLPDVIEEKDKTKNLKC